MSSKKSLSFWCFLEADSKAYDVFDIMLDANVNRLKGAIKRRIEDLKDISADHLVLWQLDEPEPVEPEDTLAQRMGLRLGNKVGFAKRLTATQKVSRLFPQHPLDDHIHIIVELPSTESLLSTPPSRKHPNSSVKDNDYEVKRKCLDVQTRCVAIHKAIEATPENLDLSNPSTFTMLPFPSLLPMPSQRFEKKKINGIDHFEYMGRSQFHELQNRVKKENFIDASEHLYLYGTSGSGKSHLLAALVYCLVREGKRVIYIPDCANLHLDPAMTIWTALNFAFYDSDVLGTIQDPHHIGTLVNFISKYQDLYIIVDQVNALETEVNDSHRAIKAEALSLLGNLRFGHRYIFSASANENSSREANRKQSGASVFPMFGGMNKDETDQWFNCHDHRIPKLSAEQRQRVEYLTGCIPLLLRCLFNVENFVEPEFRNISDLRKVTSDVDKFFRTKFGSLASDPLSKQTYLTIMSQCVRGDAVTAEDRSLCDLRYFYIDENGTGRFTCGIAFEVMISLLRTQDNTQFLGDLWYTAVSRSNNPIVQGYLAEQICLSNIATNGLRAVHPALGPMATTGFETQPPFSMFLSTDDTTQLYVPIAYNFIAVDGVILLLDRVTKQATMFSIQFTLSQKHKQSDQEFHMKLWPTWIKPITSAGFSVQSIIVWIDKKQPSEHVEHKPVKVHKVVHPEYSVVHVDVEVVDSRLASALGIKQ